jgi:hypothetical protein
MYVHGQKIYNLFVRALETVTKSERWRAFLAFLAVSANKCYFYQSKLYMRQHSQDTLGSIIPNKAKISINFPL